MGRRGTPRASCDPCRRKKVKCDKEQRNAEGISLCSFCVARGFDCVITDDARPNADTSDTDATHSNTDPNASPNAAKKRRKVSDAEGLSHPGHEASRGTDDFVTPQPATEPSLLNVTGLTRAILDDAVSSHFRTTYWCNPAVHPRHFHPRYRRYLSKIEGAATSSTAYDVFPPPDIIILAVACVGVVQLGYVSHRFELQARIFRRLERLVAQACTKQITAQPSTCSRQFCSPLTCPPRNKSVEEDNHFKPGCRLLCIP